MHNRFRLSCLLVILTGFLLHSDADENRSASVKSKDGYIDTDFLKTPRARILLLGTFHFKDAGLDDYRPQHDIDILSPERQKQVLELVQKLGRFRPTKVAIEVKPEDQSFIDERYNEYLNAKFQLKANEIYQLGFRIAKNASLKTLHGIDVLGRRYDPEFDLEEHAKKIGQEATMNTIWDKRYKVLYSFEDEMKTKMPLRQFLLHLNSEERILAGHGRYLVGSFQVGKDDDYAGVDSLTGWWYNRNLRIFANITRLVASAEDRVLVIIGAGHLPIIRHAIESSPELELVEL
ncbi:MAG TPA: DUF5694 domain-containing protein, partial [Acidobacteriota bacterium]|nr:DUF5694 domain-containing protein [Acidobacteriota bacterium]